MQCSAHNHPYMQGFGTCDNVCRATCIPCPLQRLPRTHFAQREHVLVCRYAVQQRTQLSTHKTPAIHAYGLWFLAETMCDTHWKTRRCLLYSLQAAAAIPASCRVSAAAAVSSLNPLAAAPRLHSCCCCRQLQSDRYQHGSATTSTAGSLNLLLPPHIVVPVESLGSLSLLAAGSRLQSWC